MPAHYFWFYTIKDTHMLTTIPELIQSIRPTLRCINAADAKVERAQNDGLLVDVREPEEFSLSSAERSINIPRGLLEMKMSVMFPDPEMPIYIHCATGARATLAAEQLKRIGYQQVSAITCDLSTVCGC
jgi:rhodanese-related sulfurtransferase